LLVVIAVCEDGQKIMRDHAMTNITTKSKSLETTTDSGVHLFDNWFDPIKAVCANAFANSSRRSSAVVDEALARPRYGRAKETDSGPASIVGHRHGSRTRSLTGSFGKTEITVPRLSCSEEAVFSQLLPEIERLANAKSEAKLFNQNGELSIGTADLLRYLRPPRP
jgi:hypothetical protein